MKTWQIFNLGLTKGFLDLEKHFLAHTFQCRLLPSPLVTLSWLTPDSLATLYHAQVIRVFLCYSAGAGRTGTFCALSTVLERVKAEGILDVFQTVKSLRLQRPHMVQTLVCCPAYLSMPPHHPQLLSARASSGGSCSEGPVW